VGPDFIDPGFHQAACGSFSGNLDGWMLSRMTNLEVFARGGRCRPRDHRGRHGPVRRPQRIERRGFDRRNREVLNAPVLLVADASAMARSAAALVRGFEMFDPKLDVAGIVVNRIGGDRNAELLRGSVREYCATEVVGCLPRNTSIVIPSRRLGLTLAAESLTQGSLTQTADWIEANLDLDRLLALASERASSFDAPHEAARTARPAVRIGIAQDQAFCFYYRDNLDLLARCGAELIRFSPISDSELPAGIGGLYLGGGYPELHAERLSANHSMLNAIREFAESGGPVYAECGGFMYLTEGIVHADGREHPMAGVFPTRARMQARLAARGYIQPKLTGDSLWAANCHDLRGHQSATRRSIPCRNRSRALIANRLRATGGMPSSPATSTSLPFESMACRTVCATLRQMGAHDHYMKRHLFAFAATLAFQAATVAASGVSVHVTDPQQKPIAGAVVTLTSRNAERWTATTDTAGACTFPAPAAGQYFLEAVASGFDPAPPRSINLQAGAPADLSIALGIAAVRSSVVVTASGTPQSADELSKSLTVVDSETTTLRVDRSVGEALVDVPGMRVQQLGGPLSTMYFKIRGLRNTDTAVLVDGLRLRDAAGTQADASGVLQDLVLTDNARIEVLRGTGSSLYGTDATGGVVNIVTEEGGGRTRGAIAVDGGALGSVRGTAHLAGGLLRDRVQYSLGLTHWNVTSGVDGDSPARNTSGQGQVTIRCRRSRGYPAASTPGIVSVSYGFPPDL
jgi:cobyrinic acid a,c-diamide synthase